jgi:hypothetical protein
MEGQQVITIILAIILWLPDGAEYTLAAQPTSPNTEEITKNPTRFSPPWAVLECHRTALTTSQIAASSTPSPYQSMAATATSWPAPRTQQVKVCSAETQAAHLAA